MEPAYVLHTRPWRETSLLAELFTPAHGRVGVVARGARRGRRGAAGSLQPFTRLRCEWRGRGELRTLTLAEADRSLWLAGDVLYAGLYLNELLMRLLQREDAHPGLFLRYARTLELLAAGSALEPVLREFELGLLDELGYGFPLDHDADGVPLDPGGDYRLDPDAGLVRVADESPDLGTRVVNDRADRAGRGPAGVLRLPGIDLLCIARAELDDASVRRTAKLLTRTALAPHLGPRPLRSRALFAGSPRGNLPAASGDRQQGADGTPSDPSVPDR